MKQLLERIPVQTLVWFMVLGLALLWGSSFLVLKRALVVFDPAQVFAGRMFFATLTLLPIAIKEFRNIPKHKWKLLILFAFLMNFCVTFLNALAQTGITSSLNGILSALTPLMTLLVGYSFYKSQLRTPQLFALILGMLSTVALIFPKEGEGIGDINFFAVFAILATFITGITTNMIRYNFRELTVRQLASIAFLVIFPFALGYGLYSDFTGAFLQHPTGWNALGYVAFLGVFANGIAIVVFAKLVELSSPIFASMVTYLMPIVALVWGFWDGETVTIIELGAMAFIILSVWLVNRFSHHSKL